MKSLRLTQFISYLLFNSIPQLGFQASVSLWHLFPCDQLNLTLHYLTVTNLANHYLRSAQEGFTDNPQTLLSENHQAYTSVRAEFCIASESGSHVYAKCHSS
jgi:hypothetical protein